MTSRSTIPEIERKIAKVASRMYDRGFVAGHWGNITAMTPDGSILATPDWMPLCDVGEKDLVQVDRTGLKLSGSGRPFFELGMHLAVYRGRPDVGAVVHAHPPAATAFAAAARAIDGRFSPEFTFMTGGIVPVVPFAMPGSETLSTNIANCLVDYDVVLLERHGVLAWACSPATAFGLIEQVEEIAGILLKAEALGHVEPLQPEILKLVDDARAKSGLGPAGRDRGR